MTDSSILLPQFAGHGGRKVLVLGCSPRLNGNSDLLAQSLAEGAIAQGSDAVVLNITTHVTAMMGYCKDCRRADGSCSLTDGFVEIFNNLYLPAEAVVFATPIWWYGMSAHMKNFIDRMACEISAGTEQGAGAKAAVMARPMALLLAAEESNFSSRMAIVSQFAEFCRHLRSPFVGLVNGLGNRRGEIRYDPLDPLTEAYQLGERLFDLVQTDYELDSVRSLDVWAEGQNTSPGYWPSYWR